MKSSATEVAPAGARWGIRPDLNPVRATFSALSGAAALGFDFDMMPGIVKALTAADFHKSLTTHHDHRLWQDVYRPTTSAGAVYVKLTVMDDLLIVSFKEL